MAALARTWRVGSIVEVRVIGYPPIAVSEPSMSRRSTHR